MQPENIGPNGQKQPHHLTRSPLFGLGMALLGAVIITPDTLLIRISGLEGWPLSAWRGLLIGGCMFLGWLLMARGSVKSDLKHFAKIPFLIIMVANSGNTMFFNFAAVETSVTVVLTALATVPLLAALLSFLILREPTSKRTWQAIILAMVGVMIVVMNGESAISAPQGSVLLGEIAVDGTPHNARHHYTQPRNAVDFESPRLCRLFVICVTALAIVG